MPDPLMKTVRFISVPFNYEWSGSRVSVVREKGVHSVPIELADAALAAGAAMPVEKPKTRTRATARAAKPKSDETAATNHTDDAAGLGREGLDADGGEADGAPASGAE